MANEEHLGLLRQGVKTWNAWRVANPDVRPVLIGADLTGANLIGADLTGANLISANLSGTNLSGATLAVARLTDTDLTGADLVGPDLLGVGLSGVRSIRANLTDADLSRAQLTRVQLTYADLTRANLTNTDLNSADLSWGILSKASLNMADLTDADLRRADLTDANFRELVACRTLFVDIDLSTAGALETVRHSGPSSISTDTLVRSQGKIPKVFLRGCGVPESLIEYLPSLLNAMQPIQFYSCFISYSTQNDDFARRLHGRMQQEQLRVWYAPEDMKGGDYFYTQIDEAIRVYDKLLLVLSEQSIASKWVMFELRKARRAELLGQKRKLFPIRLIGMDRLTQWECIDPDTGDDLALEVRRYHIPDFSQWKDHDAFEASFAKLLRDLKAAT